jgi:hypothetical protein
MPVLPGFSENSSGGGGFTTAAVSAKKCSFCSICRSIRRAILIRRTSVLHLIQFVRRF